MANPEHLAILAQGVEMWNRWRQENSEIATPDLTKASLRGLDLYKANFRNTDLIGADLFGATLVATNLTSAHLCWADLRMADLRMANLERAYLTWADLTEAIIGMTIFVDNDLREVRGLDNIRHNLPSSVGIDTLYKSQGDIPETFLRGCGVPEDMIAYARSIRGKAIDFYSCFISHSAKEKRFCERLYADLQAEGVRVWLFEEHAKWGETVWGEIDRSIKIYDKLIVVCSENSLQSGPVNREIERALNREDKEAKGILFPIRIDDYVFTAWEHERKADVLRKVVGDFSGWDKDAAKYEKAFERLLKGLQAEDKK